MDHHQRGLVSFRCKHRFDVTAHQWSFPKPPKTALVCVCYIWFLQRLFHQHSRWQTWVGCPPPRFRPLISSSPVPFANWPSTTKWESKWKTRALNPKNSESSSIYEMWIGGFVFVVHPSQFTHWPISAWSGILKNNLEHFDYPSLIDQNQIEWLMHKDENE